MKIFNLMSLSLVFGGLVCGCGYQFNETKGLTANYKTISVPYAQEDVDGTLTATVIKKIIQSGHFSYRDCGGALILQINQIDEYEDNIGFRYDRRKKGKLVKDIVPTETRLTAIVEVSVIEAATSRVVLGPARLTANVDYDHDYYFSRDGVNVFSLGQLIDMDEAYNAVQHPLHEALAQKIVDYISQSW